MAHTFAPSSTAGVDNGFLTPLSPAAAAGTPAAAVDAQLARLYGRATRGQPAAGIWLDDPSIAGGLICYVDADDLAGQIGSSLASWPARVGGAWAAQPAAGTAPPVVARGRAGLPCVRVPLPASGNGASVVGPRGLNLTTAGLTLAVVFDPAQRGNPGELAVFNAAAPANAFFILATGAGGTAPGFANQGSASAIKQGALLDGPNVLVLRVANGVGNFRLNGVDQGSVGYAFGTQPLTQFGLGWTQPVGGSNDFLSGPVGPSIAADYYAAAVYAGTPSDAATIALESSLVARYVRPPTLDPLMDAVVLDGDSRAWGYGPRCNSGELGPTLLRQLRVPRLQIGNVAVPGASSGYTATAAAALAVDSGARANRVFVLQVGINDIKAGGSGSSVYGNVKAWAAAIRAAGAKAVVCTVVPTCAPDGPLSSAAMTQLQSCNSAIVGDTTSFDGVADLAGNATLVVNNQLASAFTGDGLHVNDAGNRIAAGVIRPIVLSLLTA